MAIRPRSCQRCRPYSMGVPPQPAQVAKLRLARGRKELLVHWEGLAPSKASWESLKDFKHRYPNFKLEDELLADEGRDVMVGHTYSQRAKKPTSNSG